eukprot:1888577-Rhodomonas_salina.4
MTGLKGGAPDVAGNPDADTATNATNADTNAYEEARRERIASNRQLLVELGLASALEGLQVLQFQRALQFLRRLPSMSNCVKGVQAEKKKEQSTSAGGTEKRKRKAPEESLPTRHSKRLSGEGKMEEAEKEEVRVSINPKPSRIYGEMEGQDLDEIERPPPRPRVQGGRSWEERMAEIKMGALVDLSKQEAAELRRYLQAIFVVIGSTNNHYKVHLSDKANKCGCRDFRI